MKKIISALLILTMVFSMVCMSSSAAGIIIDQNFADMESLTSQFVAGAFYTNGEGLLYGYSEARVLQSLYDDTIGWFDPANPYYTWLEYDTTVTLAIGPDDLSPGDRFINLTYCNDNLMYEGRAENRQMLSFTYDVQNKHFVLGDGWDVTEEDSMLLPPVPMEIDTEGVEFFTLGMSVQKNNLRCFYNGELIFQYTDPDMLIAHAIASPFLLWNSHNFVQVKNVTVADAGFLFPNAPVTSETQATEGTEATEATTTKGEDNVTTQKETSETTTKIVEEIITNDKGETSVVTKVETEATTTPAADTNVNKPQGGSSTATGDATFVVVAAMVAALGCALVVKKVNAK